jgi:hypothetical protein
VRRCWFCTHSSYDQWSPYICVSLCPVTARACVQPLGDTAFDPAPSRCTVVPVRTGPSHYQPGTLCGVGCVLHATLYWSLPWVGCAKQLLVIEGSVLPCALLARAAMHSAFPQKTRLCSCGCVHTCAPVVVLSPCSQPVVAPKHAHAPCGTACRSCVGTADTLLCQCLAHHTVLDTARNCAI